MNTSLPRRQMRSALLRTIDELGSWRSAPGLWDAFENEDDLLRSAQQLWFTALGAAIDVAIEVGDGELAEDVTHAYQAAADRHPGLRRLLDEHQRHPAIVRSVRREHALIAQAAGVAHSSEILRGLRQQVRVPEPRRGLLARIFQPA